MYRARSDAAEGIGWDGDDDYLKPRRGKPRRGNNNEGDVQKKSAREFRRNRIQERTVLSAAQHKLHGRKTRAIPRKKVYPRQTAQSRAVVDGRIGGQLFFANTEWCIGWCGDRLGEGEVRLKRGSFFSGGGQGWQMATLALTGHKA
jgi:hypothetical protein